MGVYILAALLGLAAFCCVKCCIETIVPAIIGGLCGCILIPALTFTVCVMAETDVFPTVFYAIPIGCICGCVTGPRAAKFIMAFGTAGYGSFFTGIGAFIYSIDLDDFEFDNI